MIHKISEDRRLGWLKTTGQIGNSGYAIVMSHPFQADPLSACTSQSVQSNLFDCDLVERLGPSISFCPGLLPTQPRTIDRGAILTDVLRRNAVRRQAMLPSLDVRAEFCRSMSIAKGQAFREFAKAHEAERRRVTDEVVAEYVAKRGHLPSSSFTWQWVSAEGYRRFCHYLEKRYGVVRPANRSRNPVVYGSASGGGSTP